MDVENWNKSETIFENEGENDGPDAETGLKPRQTKSQVHPENEK